MLKENKSSVYNVLQHLSDSYEGWSHDALFYSQQIMMVCYFSVLILQ